MIVTVVGPRSATVLALLAPVVGDSSDGSVREWAGGQRHDDDIVVALGGADPTVVETLVAAASAVIVPADDAVLMAIAMSGPAAVVTVGLTQAADVQATAVDARATGTALTIALATATFETTTALLGEHQLVVLLAAVAAAGQLGVDARTAAASMAAVESPEPRVMQARRGPSGALIVNDAAGATSLSTAASLKDLALFAVDGGRSVAVLGSVDSDPDDALDDHDRLGRLVVRLNIARLVVVGHAARHIHVAAGLEGSWDGESVLVDTPEQAYDLLSGTLDENDIVLVKSSASAGLGPLGDRLGGIGE